MRRFKSSRQARVRAAFFAMAAVAVGGCTNIGGPTPPSRFYLLEPLAPASAATGGPAIGVGPIKVAEYLDRPQIVTRNSSHGIDLAEYDRWGEPVGESISRVVAMNLGRLLGSERVMRHVWREADLDARVAIDVRRLDGPPGGPLVLEAHWRVRREGGVIERVTHVEEPLADTGFDALAAAGSRALLTLSKEIAGAIAGG
jgi:uncharacterized lipoprotein YmbA